jgi:putative ABC transport system permease protein
MALLAAIVVVTNTVLVSGDATHARDRRRRALARPVADHARSDGGVALTSMVGGLAGLVIALGLVVVASRALDLPLDVRPSTVGWSLAASAISGIVAGWYPARRASRLTVVEAMRVE